MLMKKMLQLIDKDPIKFKQFACKQNCLKRPRTCQNTNAVTRYICYKTKQ